jgi:hypothetical protein
MGITPDVSWVSQGGDGLDYAVGAEKFWAVRPTGYPILTMLGWLFSRLPNNTFWDLGFLSAMCAWITSIFVFKFTKYLVNTYTGDGKYPLAPFIAALTYAASFLVWTQATIPEVYTLCTMLQVMAIYFAVRERWLACAITLAVGVGTHHLIAFTVFAIGIYATYRQVKGQIHIKLWLYPLIISIGFLAYLQIILSSGAHETTSGLGTVESQSMGSIGFVFGLPLVETWQRIKEALPILLTGLGVGYVVLPLVVKKQKLPVYLIWSMVVVHFVYYFFSNIPMWVVYLVPAFTFGAVLVGYGVSKLKWRTAPVFFVAVPLICMCFNLGTYDIGNTIDSSPTGARQFMNKLDELPNGSILYINRWGEPWLETYYYWSNNPRFNFVFEGELRYNPNSYTKFKESFGIDIPSEGNTSSTMFLKYGNLANNTMYYTSWNSSIFLEDLCTVNPGVPIYTVEHVPGTTYSDLTFTLKRYYCWESYRED